MFMEINPGIDIEVYADRYEELEELMASDVMYDDFEEDEEFYLEDPDDFPLMLEYEDDYYDEFY